MNRQIERIRSLRKALLGQISELTIDQLNESPGSQKNNIIWHLGHLIAAQQNLCYVRSGLPITVSDEYFTPFLPGTKPNRSYTVAEVKAIEKLLLSSIETFMVDYGKNLFVTYTPSVMIPKIYGVEVNNIDDAIEYLLYHEGIHVGYIMAFKTELISQCTKKNMADPSTNVE